MDSAQVAHTTPDKSSAAAAAVLAPVQSIEQLTAENKRLKQALEARELLKKTKLVAKQKKLLKELQVKHALQVALAEHQELKKIAKAVRIIVGVMYS